MSGKRFIQLVSVAGVLGLLACTSITEPSRQVGGVGYVPTVEEPSDSTLVAKDLH